jgi:hypothetical protein
MTVWQIEHSKTLGQINFSPSGELGVTYLPILECHVEQALGCWAMPALKMVG